MVEFFFRMQTTVKLYHWQTTSYAQHVASDGMLGKVMPLIDTFVEMYSGRYGRPRFDGSLTLKIPTEMTAHDMARYIRKCTDVLRDEIPKYLDESDTDLLNVRDEMLGILTQTLYLLTLN